MSPSRTRNVRPGSPAGWTRGWALLAGLAIAALAAWALLSVPATERPRVSSAKSESAGSAPPPHADIDEASRQRLREILRESEEEP